MIGKLVDLRSDTVTQPTPEMRRAMAEAEVGDDQYGEDPTVNALEDLYAQRVGKDAALFVPSGTMANQIALRVLCPPGSLVVAGEHQHIVIFEAAAAAANAGVQFHVVDDSDGKVAVGDFRAALAAADHHQPRPRLVCVEQTHMPSGGTPYPLDDLRALADAAGSTPIHMDGARLFNAEVATGVPAAGLAGPATTVMSCLSKGLCAPVGSLLAGPADVMAEARVARQRFGGAMRQAGVIAAAGLVALRTMVDRLGDDHARAARVADMVVERWPDCGLDPGGVKTNIVVFGHNDPAGLLAHLAQNGVLGGTIAPGVVRLVTHAQVDDADLEVLAKALASA